MNKPPPPVFQLPRTLHPDQVKLLEAMQQGARLQLLGALKKQLLTLERLKAKAPKDLEEQVNRKPWPTYGVRSTS